MWSSTVRISVLVALLSAVLTISASPSRPCKKPIIRKEWRTLSKKAQKNYLDAVQCILAKPAITPSKVAPGAVARYDDFIVTHILQTYSIHYVGHFLPWHRYYTAVYEQALRKECGYTGAQPYWDWNLDSPPLGSFVRSPVFDSAHGFGGNGPFVNVSSDNPFAVPGRTGGGCVTDGPFRNMTVRMGPNGDLSGNPRCLARDFSPYFAERYLGRNVTAVAMAQPDFGTFDRTIEGGPSFESSGLHGGAHYGVGGTLGQMGDLFNSPAGEAFSFFDYVSTSTEFLLYSDPIFYLHHANLDRVWWSWQKKNLAKRLTDISGPIFLMDYNNVQGGNVTLAFPLSVGVNAPNVTVADVMDVRHSVLCYDYDKVYDL
ncbi:hypothetical protein D9619_008149 [Psilocybe cf. subviscida]|uniref:Tyrosinase copper-binding domain-containing protein n=1 Tax=Psilocybe cf. subviscida TaxID=2480587 RepID=A0A8H5ET41_9AGAR|nr:hypothetical protein D9619_008149 [Psilocybe cf. subviscida]